MKDMGGEKQSRAKFFFIALKKKHLVLPFVQTERHKNSFLFSATQLWNNLALELRLFSSIGNFKHNVLANHDLFIRNCVVSTACPHCNAPVEDVKHYFLYCPMYATHRIALMYLPLLPTYWETNGFWFRTRKRLNVFCLVLATFSRMFVYSSKFSHYFPFISFFLV